MAQKTMSIDQKDILLEFPNIISNSSNNNLSKRLESLSTDIIAKSKVPSAGQTKQKYNILFAGPNGGGKSTLIKALCSQGMKTGSSTSPVNEEIFCSLESREDCSESYSIDMWRTVGQENWKEADLKDRVRKIFRTNNPVCCFFCASPMSHLQVDKVSWILDVCQEENVFCALVWTDMFRKNRWNKTSETLGNALDSYTKEGQSLGKYLFVQDKPYAANIKIYCNNQTNHPVALLCSVNSIEYVFDDKSSEKRIEKPCGVSELILTLMDILPGYILKPLCLLMSNNQPFWDYVESQMKNPWNKSFREKYITS